MDGTAAARAAHPGNQVSPHAPGRAPVPPEEIPAAFGGGKLLGTAQLAEAMMGVRQLLAELPNVIGSAVFSGLQQAPARSGFLCADCFLARAHWEAAHLAELRAAHEAAVAEAGLTVDDPRAMAVDFTAWLRPALQPGAPEGPPPQFGAEVLIAGTGHCGMHVPGNPAAAAVRGRGLIAVPGIGVHAAARLAATASGLPGMPEQAMAAMRG